MGESVMAVVMTVSMGTWLVGVIFYENFLRKTSVRKVCSEPVAYSTCQIYCVYKRSHRTADAATVTIAQTCVSASR